MAIWVRGLFWFIVRLLTRCRYRVRVEGLEKLKDLRGPTLVMPNHPGLIDPPLVLGNVRIGGGIRPVVTESMYRNPVLYPMMRLVDALEVRELSEQSQGAREQTLAMIDTIVGGLANGGSFLIYPSGRTQSRGFEVIGAARAVSEILERSPQANIVLVRTQGIWGSLFTRAQTGESPDLTRTVVRAFGWVFASLFFFLPRRDVTMTIEVIDRGDLPGLSRDKLNRFLEEWYNRGNTGEPVFVPYHHFFGPRTFDYPKLDTAGEIDVEKIKPATIKAVNELIDEHRGHPMNDEESRPETTLETLGLDSLDRMDLALKIEDRFGFRSDRVADTLGELWGLAEGQLTNAESKQPPVPDAWKKPPSTTEPLAVLADTLAEAFVRRALTNPDDVVVADRISGVLTHRRLLVASRLLGKKMAALPGDAIGVLLPASVAADVVFLGIHLAGKLPVMLNWTTGPANLAHAVKALDVRRVVTSRKLIDRLGIEIPGAEYAYMEDLRGEIGKVESLLTLLSTYVLPTRLLKRLPKQEVDKPAVVLFTSGSESTPKAVPLTHRNLTTNLRGCLEILQAKRTDAILGFLPPFHSFGLLANILAPILSGMRVVHSPDPTDAAGLVRITSGYGATIIVTTPTFLGFMFGIATAEDLRTLRILVTGAEKCPEALFARTKELAPQATILEGYGITECSPVVAGNRLDRVKLGTVGQLLPGVEMCLVDPETKQLLPEGSTGLALVRGLSIFNGYLKYDGPDPFIDIGGKRWYATGDLVSLDEDGYIHFRGRLKRFLKAGGEMISLPALEEPLSKAYPATEKGPQVAVEGIETPTGRLIVLFSTQEIALRQANTILTDAGFRGVMRLDAVKKVDSIPVLGTGKTDYKVLRKIVAEMAK